MNIIVPKYNNSIQLVWDSGFSIRCSVENSAIVLSANSEGLISLARHLLTLALDGVPRNTHIHLDEYNSLEDGSCDLVIVKN